MSPLVQNARFLQNSEDQAVLVLQLQECEVRLVLKAVAAERAARLHHQASQLFGDYVTWLR